MKNNLKIIIAITGAIILAATFPFLIWKFTSHTGAIHPAGNGAGGHLIKEQLAFAGYETPEAALQTLAWAFVNGDSDKAFACFSPEMQADITGKPNGMSKFSAEIKQNGPQIQGLQILARKILANDKAELKIKLNIIAPSKNGKGMPELFVQSMVKIGGEWKLSGSSKKYTPGWDEGSQPEPAAP